MISLPVIALAACLAVDAGSDRVTLRDLAGAFPGFDSASPDVTVALAPAPGVQRWFRLPELQRIATRLHLETSPEREVCVERAVAALNPEVLLEEMQRQLPEASLEITEYSRQPAPQGKLAFPLSGLRQTPSGGFWAGSVTYAGNRRFVVWAKVKILVNVTRVIAVENLKTGQVIAASHLRVETRAEFPPAARFLTDTESAVGKILRRNIAAGTALPAQCLEAPKEVVRGETVHVEVWSGNTRVELDAEAQASGNTGQSILVRNPVSQKRFLTVVEGKGHVSVGKVK